MPDTFSYIQKRKELYVDNFFDFNQLPNGNVKEPPVDIIRAIECLPKLIFEKELTASYLRERCHTNGNNFSTRFKYYLGKSPKEFIQFHRLKLATRLLRDENLKNLPVAEIAVELGYSGNGTFDHAFKKAYGEPPGNWREKNGSPT